MTVSQLLIGDTWVPSASGAEFTTPDPATGETIGVCAEASVLLMVGGVAAAVLTRPDRDTKRLRLRGADPVRPSA
ncbi:MAG TPA: hypothetical protein VIW24_07910 [Aldersonia sp.]